MKALALTREKALERLKAGHIVWTVWGHVHINRFVTPHERRLEVYVRYQLLKGKRTHHFMNNGQFGLLINGSWGAYFTKRTHAEAFAQEIRDGKHPLIVGDMEDRANAFDELDEMWGICDRGLGIYDEVMEERERQYEEDNGDYPHDELEFA